MKKITLLAIFSIISIVGLHAQGVGFGVKAGVNFANQDFEADGFSVSPDGKTGFHFGAFASLMFSDKLGLQPEILYSTKGSEFDLGAAGSFETDLNYLEIPILLRFQPIEILSIHAGPQFGILASAEQDGEDIKDSLKGSDLSLAVGSQVELPLGFVGGARYVLGLSDINDDSSSNTEVKNRTFQLFVGWKFM